MKNIVCIFSDDFRNELNGKHSLVGIYGDTLTINGNQHVLPKLSVTVYMHADASDMTEIHHFALHIKLNGNAIARNQIPEKILNDSLSNAQKNPDKRFSFVCNCNLALIPISKERNIIEAEVLMNNNVIYVQKLNINIKN